MKRLKGYPQWFYWLLVGCFTISAVSGILMFPSTFEFKFQWDIGWQISSNTRLFSVVLHVIASWFLLILLGALWQSHMKAGWKKNNNRKTGILLCASLCLLALSGVGLYYLSAEQTQISASIVHLLFGLCFIIVFVFHGLQGRRMRLGSPSEKIQTNYQLGLKINSHQQ